VLALQQGFFEPLDASEQTGHRLLHNDGDMAALQAQVHAALLEDAP